MTKKSNSKTAGEDAARAFLGHWLIVVGTLLATTLALSPTLALLWPRWSEGYTYSHGPLIAGLVIWLVFRQRHVIAATEQRPFVPAFVILAGLLFGWAWAFAANIAVGAAALWPLVLLCSVLAVSGWQVTKRISVPVLLLYSAIPVWEFINPLLQSTTTKAVSIILQIVGVPAFIQGNFVQIPAGIFEIAGGCSGIHFFIVALTLAAVYGHLHYGRAKDSIALILIAAAMSMALNWIRVAIIISAGHLTDMQSYLVTVDHYVFGWVLFAVMLIPFYLVANRIEQGSMNESALADESQGIESGRWAPAGFALLLLTLPVLIWVRLVNDNSTEIAIDLPAAGEWQPTESRPAWQPEFVDPDGEAQAIYVRGDRRLDVYANWYVTQSQERELFGFYTSIAGGTARVSYDNPVTAIALENDGKPLKIHEMMADYRTGERRLIWYHFLIGGESHSKNLVAQLRLGLLALIGAEQSGTIAVSAVCKDSDCVAARELLTGAFPTINRALTDSLLALEQEPKQE